MNKRHSTVWFALTLVYGITAISFWGKEGLFTAILWSPLFLLVLTLIYRSTIKDRKPTPPVPGDR